MNNLGWTALLEAVILGDGSRRYQQIVTTFSTPARSQDRRSSRRDSAAACRAARPARGGANPAERLASRSSKDLFQGRGRMTGHLRNVLAHLGQLADRDCGVCADPGVDLPRRRAVDGT